MLRIESLVVGLLLAINLPAQVQEGAAEKFGSIFKSEVDGLIATLAKHAVAHGALGDGSCLQTARALTAMGNCHRFYSLGDGPLVRKAVNHLFVHRRADGSFADTDGAALVTTEWVVHALSSLAPEVHAQEIEQARLWLERQPGEGQDPWEELLDQTTQAVADQGSPLTVGAAVAERSALAAAGANPSTANLSTANLSTANLSSIDLDSMVDDLCRLVACQVIARRMDRAQNSKSAGTWNKTRQRGIDFLLGQQEGGIFQIVTPEGTFPDMGLTGMGLAALQTKPPAQRTPAERQAIRDGLGFLISQQNQEGSFGRENVNYTTCAAVLALSMSGDQHNAAILLRAQHYILSIQNIEDRDYARSDRDYGSIGYGGDQRGDLSNLQFAVEALRKTGLPDDHEALAKALVFLQRTQNLEAVNHFEARTRDGSDGTWHQVHSGDDGGAAYYPGNSPAGYLELADGSKIPRSYGSMTYALLKTYTLCGLSSDDPRVAAAVHWIATHWTLEENPGSSPSLGEKAKYQGLYYYFMVLAQSLDLVDKGQFALEDQAGEPVDWRSELSGHLQSLQRADGSWLNEKNGRWWESQAVICTIYAMLALDHCQR